MAVLMQRLALLAGVLAALAGTWWLYREPPRPESDALEPGIERNQPDLLGENIQFNQLRPDGSLQYRLHASTIRQFDAEQLTRMTTPNLHLTSQARAPWDVESAHGYIRRRTGPAGQPEDVVYLRERVKLVQIHPTSGTVTLRSESFYIYPDRQYAETDQDVMIDTDVGRTLAAGLVADLESGLLKLSSSATQRVHTIVLPDQFKKS